MNANRRGSSSLILILILVIVVIGVLAGGYYLSTKESVEVDKGIYQDTQTGFSLVIPAAWNEIGYVVEKETGDASDAKVFRFVLNYKDENGDSHKFSSVSTIAAVPISAVSSFCQSSPTDCALTEEIGRNSVYVFLSVTTSPEAWADCVQGNPRFDQAFYEQNKVMCDAGRVVLSYPERNPAAFTVTEPK